MAKQLPTLLETTLGVFLHDVGKFVQRAYGSVDNLPAQVRNCDSTLLPVYQGRYSHKHVLGTELFFDWVKHGNLQFPDGIDVQTVRNVAVFHHKPDAAKPEIGAIGWLAAEADRLSSGMDRKARDEQAELEDKAWDRFIRTPLVSPFSGVQLGLGEPRRVQIPLQELDPGENLMPQDKVNAHDYQSRYDALWKRLREELEQVFALRNTDLFCEALLSLSDRYFFAVPSSTVDEPDISLHDHNRSAAAIAAALYQWHQADGSLDDEAKIKDRTIRKFRFLVGDLSGIQKSLFLLAAQRVKGVNKILRARSFLLSITMEAAALAVRRALGLPVFSVLQNGGGRFLLLVADTPGLEDNVRRLRQEIDHWLLDRYYGEIALNLVLGPPFAGTELMLKDGGFRPLMDRLGDAVDAAKLRPFDGTLRTIHKGAAFGEEACSACGVRPGKHRVEDAENQLRCDACDAEYRLGGALPRVRYLSWEAEPDRHPANSIDFFAGLQLRWYDEMPGPAGQERLSSLARLFARPKPAPGPFALRFFATYVPVLTAGECNKPAYRILSEEARQTGPGELKTFEHLAADSVEEEGDDLKGQLLLALLKADVDRLGFIFGRGLNPPSLSRTAALSRMMELFFTGYLYDLLHREFPFTYTVYAGGDDLLLIGPWRQTLELAERLRERFGAWTGHNPNVTLSAGIELMKTSHPVNRTAAAAEERLERSKDQGRDRICVINAEPYPWPDFGRELERAERLNDYLRSGALSDAFVYRILEFDRERRLAELTAAGRKPQVLDLQSASWRARWGYQLARNVRDNQRLDNEQERRKVIEFLNGLLGLDADLQRREGAVVSPRVAVSIALYRNRKPTERS